jgi:hypothetical protein
MLEVMTRDEALTHFDGNVAKAAQEMRITPQAIYLWPREGALPRSAEDTVLAALYRREHAEPATAQG